MRFKIDKRALHHHNIDLEDARLVRELTTALVKELSDFLKSVVLFGSAVQEGLQAADIDVLLIIDDLTTVVSEEVIGAYRVIVEKTAGAVSPRFHINTLKLSSFWEHARSGDPVLVNMLRDGVVFHDVGIFEPMQHLLHDGRIRPSKEAIASYYARAPATLQNADWHIMQGCIDLYWACIDAAHAAVMKHGDVPGAPSQVGELLKKHFSRTVRRSTLSIMEEFYSLQKNVTHRNIERVSGQDFDLYRKKAKLFVDAMRSIVDKP